MAVRLLAYEVADICLGKPPLRSLSISATVADALSALKSSSDTCLSVWTCDHSKSAAEECPCVGKVCMVDVICYLCKDKNLSSPSSALKSPVSVLLPKLPGLVRHVEPSSRLFSCGTGKDGDSFLVEWNESEGAIKRTYSGFRKKSVGVEQFDTTQNHFLAVGEDHQIKFWNMDNNDILTSMDAEGGLPNGVDPMARNMEKPKTLDDVTDKTKPWQLAEIIDPAQCRQVTMPDSMDAVNKVARLLYTNSGFDVLALGSNGIQKLWKWTRSEQNPGGKCYQEQLLIK